MYHAGMQLPMLIYLEVRTSGTGWRGSTALPLGRGAALRPRHLFRREQPHAGLLKHRAGVCQLMCFDEQNCPSVADKARAIIQVEVVLPKQFRDLSQGPGPVGDLDGEHFEQRHHQPALLEALHRHVRLVNQEFHDAETPVVGDRNPANIDTGLGEDTGDPRSLAGFVFNENGHQVHGVHKSPLRESCPWGHKDS